MPIAVLSPPILKIKAILEAALPQVKAIPPHDPKAILPPKAPVNTVEGVATEVGSFVGVCLLYCIPMMHLVLIPCFVDDRRYSPSRPDRCGRCQGLPRPSPSSRVCPLWMSK